MLVETDQQAGGVAANQGEPQNENTAFAAFLNAATLGTAGRLTFQEQNEESPRTVRGEVTNAHVGSAWIGFTINGETFRTLTIADRNRFYKWYKDGGKELFGEEEDDRLFGPPGVIFVKISGLTQS